MFRNLILILLIGMGLFHWLAPTWNYLALIQPLSEETPRYNMEISLAISHAYGIGTLLLVFWFLPFFNQYSHPVGYAITFLVACCFWDLSLHFSFFETFYQREPAPYTLTLLFFHFTFCAFFAIYLYLSSESHRFNTECKVACYLTGISSILVIISGFSEPFVALIYCFTTMVGVWFGAQGALFSKRKTFKSNQIGWILSLPGTLVLAYLLLAPYVSDWAGVQILAHKNPKFLTQLEVLGKTLSPSEKKQKEFQEHYKNTLKTDRQHYRHSAKYLMAFLFLALFLKTQKKSKPIETDPLSNLTENINPSLQKPEPLEPAEIITEENQKIPTEIEKNETEKLPHL